MDHAWLLDFLALARSGSFSKAALHRNTTQSTLSKRIRALEQWVDAELFDRSALPIRLTDAGRAFEPGVQDVTERLVTSRNRARQAAGRIQAALAFAATHAVAFSFFPGWLQRVERDLGRFPLKLDCHRADRCFEALDDGKVELVMCHVPLRPMEGLGAARFASVLLAADDAVPVSAPDAAGRPAHPLPGRAARPTAYLSLAQGSWMGSAVRVLIAEREPAPVLDTVFESPLTEAVKSMALHGHGLAWLPRSMIGGELASGRLCLAGDADWLVPMQIRLFRSGRTMTPRAEALWNHVRAAGAGGE
ncbi:MAG: LysR family transcriptional regulator [Rhizobiales bacterium]|nr:LysR family transcriptional regulator [Hyphomicrobiales bacterium]